jgi:hypothetical protein
MVLRIGAALALVMLWSCAGDGEVAGSEPVGAVQEAAKIPDAPGSDTGEAPVQASVGQVAATPVAAPEATTPADAERSVQAGGGQGLLVKVKKLNVRQGPGTDHPVTHTLKKGDLVTPVGCERQWCKLGEGQFVAQKYLSKGP